MRVLVKGDKHQAALAAAERGIPFAFVDEWHHAEGAQQTYGNVPDSYWDQVTKWFCEPPRDAPFPVGTCLHYSGTRPTEEN